MSWVYCEPKSRTRTVCSVVIASAPCPKTGGRKAGHGLGLGLGMTSLQQVPQFFPWLEADGVAGRDLDLDAGFRVAADSLLALLDLENAEAAQLDALAAGER